jgi:phosphoribosyl 1,2-cyclic phosphodiesterase
MRVFLFLRFQGKSMIKFCSLYSSSSGNSVFVGDGSTRLLVDAGVSCKKILQALEGIGERGEDIQGVLVTHEHSDHIQGLSVLCRKLHIPVYATAPTIRQMAVNKKEQLEFRPIEKGKTLAIGDVEVLPFAVPHDAADPVGFRFTFPKEGKVVCTATDMGCVTQEMRQHLEGCDVAYLESNHDRNMLLSGRYPYYLKQRILSDRGHLCNDDCGQLAGDLVEKGTKHLVLGHLSQENNMPQVAYLTCQNLLQQRGMAVEEDYTLSVARRDQWGQPILL